MSHSPKEDLKAEILNYLARNPEGKDTLEGIARFWLRKQRVELCVEDVHEAVMSLLNEGLLSEVKGGHSRQQSPGSSIVYKLTDKAHRSSE
jgi:hypothetical protein